MPIIFCGFLVWVDLNSGPIRTVQIVVRFLKSNDWNFGIGMVDNLVLSC